APLNVPPELSRNRGIACHSYHLEKSPALKKLTEGLTDFVLAVPCPGQPCPSSRFLAPQATHVATEALGKRERAALLDVAASSPNEIPLKIVERMEGAFLTLPCPDSRLGYPPEWKKDLEYLEPESLAAGTRGRIRVDRSWSLHIYGVGVGDGGYYACSVLGVERARYRLVVHALF
ncbi:unnamed protein product, partial [Darwinula stevensoni]